jgi:hypothetical protein
MEQIGNWGAAEWPTALSENTWHYIEMHIAPPSTSTLLEFWVDGVKNSTSLTANFSGSTAFNQIDFGDVAIGSGNGTATFYLDEFIASNAYNGPVNSDIPTAPPAVYDGTTTGVETSTTTSTTQLSANWTAASDPQSGISGYKYAIGTTAGGTNVVGWTSLGNVLTVTKTGLSLNVGTTYYFSVEAVNGVGVTGPARNSSGCTVVSSSAYFQDNFESWSSWGGAWSSVVGGTQSTLNTSTTEAAKSTTHSLKLTLPSAGYLQKNFSPVITGDTYTRFYVFLPTGWTAANSGTVPILYVTDGTYSGRICLEDGRIALEETKGWTGTSTPSSLTENAWHSVEIHVAPPSTSTLLECWVDGTKLTTTLTADFSSGSGCTLLQFGDVTGGNSGSFYLDEFICSGSYNGP